MVCRTITPFLTSLLTPPYHLEEALKAKLLPQLDDADITTHAEQVFTWTIVDWSALPDKLYGPTFVLGDVAWRLYLFPEGNNTPSVSIYLAGSPFEEYAIDNDPPAEPVDQEQQTALQGQPQQQPKLQQSKPPKDWAVCAQFGIVLWNPEDPSSLTYNCATHRFTLEEADWGFSKFYDLRRLFTKQSPLENPIISNNKANFSVYIRIVNDPTGVLWHNMRNYNSKRATGYTGLKNQGATCYLNSLLQSLYFTTAFRDAVLQVPTDSETDGIPYALQRLFTQLNTSETPVGTLQLTKSFGWDTADAFTQHDVQELNRVLMDNLEGKMKGTKVEGALNKMFVGQFKSYIKCVNVDFESSRIEDYWDIQLNVKGMKNLEDSFKDYIQVETLDGENQYMATGYGLQDAKKGVVFKSFPPVLHLQLQRYEFDPMRGDTIKINDRYEFPTEVDLAPFLDEDSRDPNESYVYALHGVLVHCGDLNIGHYYALLKPTKDGPWYKFDDDKVTRVTMKEVLDDNFGGDQTPDGRLSATRAANYWRHNSAYMLVYLRKSKLDEILFNASIPENIVEREAMLELEEEQRRRDKEEQHLYMTIRIATVERQFRNYSAFDLAIYPQKNEAASYGQQDQPPEAHAEKMRINKLTTPGELLDRLAESQPGLDRKTIRLWSMTHRDNYTYRLNEAIPDRYDLTMEKVAYKHCSSTSEMNLFLEIPSPEVLESFNGDVRAMYAPQNRERGERILLFLKYFDPITQTLRGIFSHAVYSEDMTITIIPVIRKAMGWSDDVPVRIWEEIKPEMIEPIGLDITFGQADLVNSDIITFEREYTEEELEKVVPADGFPTPVEYYDFLVLREQLIFRHRVDHEAEKDGIVKHVAEPIPDISLWLHRNATYDTLAAKISKKINVEATHLQFFTATLQGQIVAPVRRQGNNSATVESILHQPHSYSNLLLYDILTMSLQEFETKKLVKFLWLPKEGILHDQRHESLVPKTATVSEILAELPGKVDGLKPEELGQVKVWLVQNHRIESQLPPSYPVISFQPYQQLCIGLMSDDEFAYYNIPEKRALYRMVEVFHFYRDINSTHGVPFTFVLKKGEKLSETKARLQKTLGMFDKVFERVKFAIVRSSDASQALSPRGGRATAINSTGNAVQTDAFNNYEDNGGGIIPMWPSMRYVVDNEAFANGNNNEGPLSPALAAVTSPNGNGTNDGAYNDDLELFEEIADNECLGLDHMNRAPRRKVAGERAIFIKS